MLTPILGYGRLTVTEDNWVDLSWLDDLPRYDRRELSPQARLGLSVARGVQVQRSFGATFAEAIDALAEHHRRAPRTIRRWIGKAQKELTGDIRQCAECDRALPRGSRSSRRYCDEHQTTNARVARHRKRREVEGPRPAGGLGASR